VPPTDAADFAFAFDAATAVTRAEGGALVADLDPGWDVGGDILNGGYLLAVVARAAALDSPHPHPVALSGSFLRATAPGPATLTVTQGPAGRTLAHSTVALGKDDGPTLLVQVTTATLGDDEPEYLAPRPDVPPVEECHTVRELVERERAVREDAGRQARQRTPAVGLSRQIETRLDPATAGWAIGRPSGEPLIRAWVRLTDGRAPDPLALITFSDVLPPVTWGLGQYGWAPTVQLQVLVRALPAPGWCLVESRAGELAGGWLDEDYRIWDSTGRLVAQSRQLARAPKRR
jgi:acyl-Coa thioesterase superfamily protein/acyl-CoA thioesterase superfamily protein